MPDLESGLFTIPTRWGYVIAGPQNTPDTITNTIQVFTNSHSTEPVDPNDTEKELDSEEILDLESIGIKDSPNTEDGEIKEMSALEDGEIREMSTLTATPNLIPIDQFSTLTRLYRTVVFVLRFIAIALKLTHQSKSGNQKTQFFHDVTQKGPIMAKDIETAKTVIIRQVQREHFPTSVKILLNMKTNERDNLVTQLGLILDENNLLRACGRIEHSELPANQKFPILLPSQDHFTTLIVQHFHVKLHHVGVKHTLSEIRIEYWVIKG